MAGIERTLPATPGVCTGREDKGRPLGRHTGSAVPMKVFPFKHSESLSSSVLGAAVLPFVLLLPSHASRPQSRHLPCSPAGAQHLRKEQAPILMERWLFSQQLCLWAQGNVRIGVPSSLQQCHDAGSGVRQTLVISNVQPWPMEVSRVYKNPKQDLGSL